MPDMPEGEIDFSKTLLGNDPVGPLSKLLWECMSIHAVGSVDPLIRMYMSQNAASTAWHLTDWSWKLCPLDKRGALVAAVEATSESWNDYAVAVRRKNEDLAICRQLATAGKHVTVSRDEMKNLSVEVETVDDTGDVLIWICLDDQRIPDFDVYARALGWWIDLYVHVGFPEAEKLREILNRAMVFVDSSSVLR